MGRKSTPGLYKRGKFWHISKTIYGVKVCESTREENLDRAEEYLRKKMEEAKAARVYGVRPKRTFNDAVRKYIDESTKASLEDDLLHLRHLKPYMGHLYLEQIHMGSLQQFILDRKTQGVKNRTVNFGIKMVRQILNLAAGEWVDDNGYPWLHAAPKIKLMSESDSRKPYPLTWEEQRKFFPELPSHLAVMSLFKVNTGCREGEVCGLKWEWEVRIPELNTSVFVVPGTQVKNRQDRIVVLNDVAKRVVKQVRGVHPVYVFTYKGHGVQRMNGHAWRKARQRAGLPHVRVHDLKHTYGTRLRFAGVPEEDRKDLLGHKSGRSITTHYSAADWSRLIELTNKVKETDQVPSLILVGRKVG